jgi:hypothetical protein
MLKSIFSPSATNTKKYELLRDQTIDFAGVTLYRIRALKDFGTVKASDLGGYVASERTSTRMEETPGLPIAPSPTAIREFTGMPKSKINPGSVETPVSLIGLWCAVRKPMEKPGYTAMALFMGSGSAASVSPVLIIKLRRRLYFS